MIFGEFYPVLPSGGVDGGVEGYGLSHVVDFSVCLSEGIIDGVGWGDVLV